MARSEYEKVGQADNAEPFNVGGDSDDEETLPGISDDVRRHDVKTLGAEEEAEKLLGVPAGSTRSASGRGDGYRRERRSKRRREGEKRELMHEMEEGGPRSSSADSSEPSSEVDMVRSAETQGRGKVRFTESRSWDMVLIRHSQRLRASASLQPYKSSSS